MSDRTRLQQSRRGGPSCEQVIVIRKQPRLASRGGSDNTKQRVRQQLIDMVLGKITYWYISMTYWVILMEENIVLDL